MDHPMLSLQENDWRRELGTASVRTAIPSLLWIEDLP
jgi:hypothetical protein